MGEIIRGRSDTQVERCAGHQAVCPRTKIMAAARDHVRLPRLEGRSRKQLPSNTELVGEGRALQCGALENPGVDGNATMPHPDESRRKGFSSIGIGVARTNAASSHNPALAAQRTTIDRVSWWTGIPLAR
jgi:hypothetical protein